jgi:uncharacterized membrane protein
VPLEAPILALAIGLIEFGGALVIVAHALAALVLLALRRRTIEEARLILVEGALSGLGFKLSATLLKTIVLQTPRQIAAFAAVLVLRTLIKAVLNRDRRRLQVRDPG